MRSKEIDARERKRSRKSATVYASVGDSPKIAKMRRENKSEQQKRKKLNINLFAFTCFMLALGAWGLFSLFSSTLNALTSHSTHFQFHFFWRGMMVFQSVVWHTSTISLTYTPVDCYRTHTPTLLGIVLKTTNVLIWCGGCSFFSSFASHLLKHNTFQ